MKYLLIIASIILSSTIICFIQRAFLRKGILDKINSRSSHSVTATRSGGISVFLAVFTISSISYILGIELYDYSFLIPLTILTCIGLYDDIYTLDFKLKFIFQIIVAKIIIDNGLIIDNLHGFLGIFELNRIIAQIFTLLIIVALINSINFIDGIDSLAKSMVLLFVISFELFIYTQSPFINLSYIVIGSLIPLYYFNLKKNKKVFLGDSGSYFLGGLVSIYVIYVLTNSYIIKPVYDLNKILFIISILFYPIIDLIRVSILRIMKGDSPFKADQNHIHHIVNRIFENQLSTLIVLISSSIIILIIFQIVF